MARVTVEDCIDKVDNRFDLVLMASHRARAISSGASCSIAAGVSARANRRGAATAVVWSLVRRLKIHPMRVRKGSRRSAAIRVNTGAFHPGAALRKIRRAPPTVALVSGAGLRERKMRVGLLCAGRAVESCAECDFIARTFSAPDLVKETAGVDSFDARTG